MRVRMANDKLLLSIDRNLWAVSAALSLLIELMAFGEGFWWGLW